MEAKLEGLQAETDELLVKITELRRSCPEKIREKFFLQLEDLERAMPGVSETLSPLDINTELDDAVLDGLINQLGRLKELNEVYNICVCQIRPHSQFLDW